MTLASIAAQDPLAEFCIGRTLPLEGGLVDNRADPGSVTNFGVSLRWALAEAKVHPDLLPLLDVDHDTHVDRADIEGLTQDLAADVFYVAWWRPGSYARLIPNMVAWKTFDIAVNTGPKRAGLILQSALAHSGSAVAADGAIGPQTVAAVQRQAKIDGGIALLSNMRLEQAGFYRSLVVHEPQLHTFLDGWLHRAAA